MGATARPRDAWDQARSLAAALATRDVLPAPVHVRVIDARDPSIVRARLAAMIAALVAALVAALIASGLARWRALVAAPASTGRATGAVRAGELAVRLGVTIAVPIAIVLLGRIDLPGLGDRSPGTFAPSLTSLGVFAVIDAYLLVELAALIVPAWRARRLGGREARQPLLVATAALAAALAIVQAWLVATYLRYVGFEIDRWEIIGILCAGALAFPLGAAAIDRWGLGSGWAAILAVPAIQWVYALIDHGNRAAIAQGLGEGVLVAWIVVGAARTQIRGAVRLPLGGFVASTAGLAIVGAIFGLLGFALGTAPFAISTTLFLARPSVRLCTAALVGAALGAAWSRRPSGAAIAASTAIALAVVAIELAITTSGEDVGPSAAFATAAIADVIVEARARARGRWREVAQTGDVDRADALLAGAERPRFARALHVRALLRFFAPFAPVRVFEADDHDRA
jgi:hypothetical protein